MHGVDGGYRRDDKSDSAVAHCLVLSGANSEDQKTECAVSSVRGDVGDVGVELDVCGFNVFVRRLIVWLVEAEYFGCGNSAL